MTLERLAKREPTMRRALAMLAERVPRGALIVETGCVRAADDWEGAGMSTLVFGEWAAEHGAEVWSVDNDASHVAFADSLVDHRRVSLFCDDSLVWLRDLSPRLAWRRIDLLYLDSLDYPYGELLDLYGGKTDLGMAIASLAAKTEAQIVDEHRDLIAPSQRHAAREALAAQPHLSKQALVLIDDAALPGGGKARMAEMILEAFDFAPVRRGYQSLWAR